MVHRPTEFSAFEFVVLSGLRAAQLMRGCTPRSRERPQADCHGADRSGDRKVVQAERAVMSPLD